MWCPGIMDFYCVVLLHGIDTQLHQHQDREDMQQVHVGAPDLVHVPSAHFGKVHSPAKMPGAQPELLKAPRKDFAHT